MFKMLTMITLFSVMLMFLDGQQLADVQCGLSRERMDARVVNEFRVLDIRKWVDYEQLNTA
jgi:hypothetical protein